MRLIPWTVAAVIGFAGLASAIEPAESNERRVLIFEGAGPAELTKGKVLILVENERTLEGDIERVGDNYRIRRSFGETLVPGDQVLKLCADREAAYAYLRGRSNLRDPDERMRLARWCLARGMKSQALVEVKAVVDLRPSNAEAQRLAKSLERSVAVATVPAKASSATAEPANLPNLPLELDVETVGVFTNKVQPILMNTCASCHANGHGGGFKLSRVFDGNPSSRRTTQQNLVAVLSQINTENLAASPLLVRSVSLHGEAAQAPLKGKQTPAYRILEDWLRQASANAAPREAVVPTILPAAAKVEVAPDPSAAKPDTVFASAVKQAAQGGVPGLTPATPPKPTNDKDPFDPEIFNKQNP